VGFDHDDPEGHALLFDDGAVDGHRFFPLPRFGARWDRADPAAVLDALDVRPSRRTLDAALPAFALVRRCFAMISISWLSLYHLRVAAASEIRNAPCGRFVRRGLGELSRAQPKVVGEPAALASGAATLAAPAASWLVGDTNELAVCTLEFVSRPSASVG
jgi:hypothetical protein